MDYQSITQNVQDQQQSAFLKLKAAEQSLKTIKYPTINHTAQIDLKLINYAAMKQFITNRLQFLRFPLPENKPQPQPLLLAQQSGFVQANQLVPKKRFQPPTKTTDKPSKQQPQQQQSNIEDNILQRIEQDIIEVSDRPTNWTDIVGLDHVRDQVVEIALWPLENPKLFEGIISPGSGLLLFGPPGTGKTMIGKAIASEGKATFFSVKASTLTSKYVGEGEKTVRALFTLAAQRQPSVIFFDEIDSLLCARSDKDNETSRQIKTEFMVQLEGASRSSNDRIVFIGATNRPQELDDAIKRRFQKKIYIPLPNQEGRNSYFRTLIEKESLEGKKIELSQQEIEELIRRTKGFSGADLRNLSREACMYPVRDAVKQYGVKNLQIQQIRAANVNDFNLGLNIVKPTVNMNDLKDYLKWNEQFGSYNYDNQTLDT